MTVSGSIPAWLPLLKKPYQNALGSRSVWELAAPDGSIVRIERTGQGLNNALYKVRAGAEVYACKLFVADERRRAEREWSALRALSAACVSLAPRPVSFDPEGLLPQPVIVSHWVEGDVLSGHPVSAPGLASLVGAMRQIHAVPPSPDAERLHAWHQPASYAAYLAEIHVFAAQVQDWIGRLAPKRNDLPPLVADLPDRWPLIAGTVRLAEATVRAAGSCGACPHPALVRADGNPDHVVRTCAGGIVFVDWACSGWGDPAYDLAELRWHPRSLRVAAPLWDAALAGYVPAPADSGFSERMGVYARLLPARWVSRTALHLLEGAGLADGRPRLTRVPARFYQTVSRQLDCYLAALGLLDPRNPKGALTSKLRRTRYAGALRPESSLASRAAGALCRVDESPDP